MRVQPWTMLLVLASVSLQSTTHDSPMSFLTATLTMLLVLASVYLQSTTHDSPMSFLTATLTMLIVLASIYNLPHTTHL